MQRLRSKGAGPVLEGPAAARASRSRARSCKSDGGTSPESDFLLITVYPDGGDDWNQMDRLIQETMVQEGVRGIVSAIWCVPEIYASLGIEKLPAVTINDRVVLQGRVPRRADLVRWFDKLVPRDRRLRRRRPRRIGWPSSLEEAVTWLIEDMEEADKRSLASAGDWDLSMLHFGMGMAIRNGFGLWRGNASLLRDCGTADADDASMVIIRAVRDRLREEGYR